ncbi:NmrA family NAD(P)-binding protein [Paenibacillus sp. KACC 21273]|uniref:SDR family oxidoreductase n=1 Tax=Paenibacillus sp. KACC 21273 TaxID=3025665 RepID=UPI002365A303|nr:NmrA family NAD(P)-binding protein [Paenibacillus sp. KACC 21273]WDF52624.1 NmrA family NAD(P)-binding protein [Paenibacillus sp. KACC 21273]
METILVYGASGVQGGAVARLLTSKGVTVRTITRQEQNVASLQEQGIEAFVGDLSILETLHEVNSNVDKVFLNMPIEYDTKMVKQHITNAVQAAQQANVKLIVVNSNGFLPEQPTDAITLEVKREMIQYVQQSGIPTIVVKPTLYMENFLIPGLINNGMLFYPVPADKPIPWISSEDAAQYHYYALSHPELAGQTILAAGPEALTGTELGNCFTEVLEQLITFRSLNYDDFEASLTPVMGAQQAAGIAGFYRWIGDNIDSLNYYDVQDRVLIPDLQITPLKTWLQQPHIHNIIRS